MLVLSIRTKVKIISNHKGKYMKNNLKETQYNRKKTIMLSLTAVFVALIIVSAFIKIPIPEIPCTMQTFFVQLASSLLGWNWGSLAIALYIFMGLIGIPVFTNGGGIGYVLQPTFGYLIGFLLGSIAGGLIIKLFKKKTYFCYFLGNLTNLLISYACGMLYFFLIKSFYFGESVTAYTVFVSSFLIFLPVDMVFTILASLIAYKLTPILNKITQKSVTATDIAEAENDKNFNITDDNFNICDNQNCKNNDFENDINTTTTDIKNDNDNNTNIKSS